MRSSRKKKKGKLNQASGAKKKKSRKSLTKMLLPTDSDPFRIIVNYKGIKGRNCLYYKKIDGVSFYFPASDTITSICPFPKKYIAQFLINIKINTTSTNFASKGQRQLSLSADYFLRFWQYLITTKMYTESLIKWELNIIEACREFLEIQNPNTTKAVLEIDEFLMQFSTKDSPAKWKADINKLAEITLPVLISRQEEDLIEVSSSEVEASQRNRERKRLLDKDPEEKSAESQKAPKRKRNAQEEEVHASQPKKQRSAGEEAKDNCIVLPIEFSDRVTYLRFKPINETGMGVVLIDLWRLVSSEGEPSRKTFLKKLGLKIEVNVKLEKGLWEMKGKRNSLNYEVITIESAFALLDSLSKSLLKKSSENIEILRQQLFNRERQFRKEIFEESPITLPTCVTVKHSVHKENRHAIEKPVTRAVCSETVLPKPMESGGSSSAASSHSVSAATFFEVKKEVGQSDVGMETGPSGHLSLVNYALESTNPFGTVPRLGLFSNPLVANVDDIFDQNMQEGKESDNSPRGEPLSLVLQAPVIFDSEERRPADDYWHTEAEASLIPHSMFYSSLLQKPQYRPEQDIGHSQLPTDEANTAGTTLDKR